MNRRDFLQYTPRLVFLAATTTSMTACGLFDEKEMRLGEIEQLKNKPFHIISFNRKDIFVTQSAGEWVIFSLICRHKKCTVAYKPQEEQFICPCHDGIYDKNGKVLSGPPPAPLRRFKHEIRNGELWVLNVYV